MAGIPQVELPRLPLQPQRINLLQQHFLQQIEAAKAAAVDASASSNVKENVPPPRGAAPPAEKTLAKHWSKHRRAYLEALKVAQTLDIYGVDDKGKGKEKKAGYTKLVENPILVKYWEKLEIPAPSFSAAQANIEAAAENAAKLAKEQPWRSGSEPLEHEVDSTEYTHTYTHTCALLHLKTPKSAHTHTYTSTFTY